LSNGRRYFGPKDWLEVKTALARKLADAAAELHDVRFAHQAVEELLASWPAESPTGPDAVSARSLWTAALVSYARCFRGGVRRGSAKAIEDGLSGLDRVMHDYAMAMRDKHIAHSVNAFEQAKVGVVLGPGRDFEAEAVAPWELFSVLPDRPTVERFSRHAWRVHLLQTNAMQNLVDQVAKELRSWSGQQRGQLRHLELNVASPDPTRRRPGG
jgi:hypothetical protein